MIDTIRNKIQKLLHKRKYVKENITEIRYRI